MYTKLKCISDMQGTRGQFVAGGNVYKSRNRADSITDCGRNDVGQTTAEINRGLFHSLAEMESLGVSIVLFPRVHFEGSYVTTDQDNQVRARRALWDKDRAWSTLPVLGAALGVKQSCEQRHSDQWCPVRTNSASLKARWLSVNWEGARWPCCAYVCRI